jgi:trans-L-3-hydroxyproline dehydratase
MANKMTNTSDITGKLEKFRSWKPPSDWQKISTIDLHTAGEPLRVILTGYPDLDGETILAKRSFARREYDQLRKSLMWEPRGHADMYGCIITPATARESDFGVLFLHNEGYSTMCGHAIIAITKLAVEFALVETVFPTTQVNIETPAGQITAYADVTREGHVTDVYFHNVPSFVLELDAEIELKGLGSIKYDLAYGGAFYAYVQARDVGLECTPEYLNQLIETGMRIKKAVQATGTVKHPFEGDLSFLYGTIFVGDPLNGADSRNVCVFAEGEVDRSPTGTGVSGRMAIHRARKEIELDELMTIESIIGTKFTGSVIREVSFGPFDAVIPKVGGNAYITGRNEFLIDPNDPLKNGFILR